MAENNQNLSGQIMDEMNKLCCLSELVRNGFGEGLELTMAAQIGFGKLIKEISTRLCDIGSEIGELEASNT